MRLNTALLSLECPQQAFAAPLTRCLSVSSSEMNERRGRSVIYHVLISSPYRSRKLLKSQTFDKKCFPKLHAMSWSCGANFDDESFVDSRGLDESFEENGRGDSHSMVFWTTPSSKIRLQTSNWFLQSSVDILDPIALGIRPEPPNWPERESIMWTSLEQKAKSFDLPVSLRMIQKKIQLRKGLKVLEGSASCSVKKALSSMVFIMIELQSQALKIREALCNEDLEMIIKKVQFDMQSSFAWLFQQVFSRTPALMIYVIILLANFSLHSTSLNVAVAQASLVCETTMEMASVQHASTENSITISDDSAWGKEDWLLAQGIPSNLSKSTPYINISPKEFLQVGDPELKSAAEVFLWNSMLDEATKMQADQGVVVLDHEVLQRFVSPISVELEADDYLEYIRTAMIYKMGLSQEPNNPLFLCNYAQFLLLVAHDPDRAEECFKKAVQVEPPDAESHSLYADFLWRVRNDLWGAEERYLQALAAEPDSTHHISKYAEFLWRTGGEETCFPLNAPNKNDLK